MAENVLSVGVCVPVSKGMFGREGSAKLCKTHVLEALGVDDSLSFPLKGRNGMESYGMVLSDCDMNRCESM